MIHSFFKRSMSLMAVVLVLISTMIVPAFAITPEQTAACKILTDTYLGKTCTGDSDATHSYEMTITVGGVPTKVYLDGRPDVNDVGVSIDKDGELKIFGMSNGDANTWNQFFAKYKAVIVGISGIGAITFIALFIFQFMKLGASAGNPQARSMALSGCLWTGIAAAALGAVSIIAGFFYNAV